MSKVFEALSEDIAAAAGGPMGSPVILKWRKHFSTMEKAKRACEKDYGDKIKWSRGTKKCESGDLLYIMYTIQQINVD